MPPPTLSKEGFGHLPIVEVDPNSLTGFACGKQHLDAFLKDEALDLQKQYIGFTRVVFHRDFDGPVGYFTLSNDAIPLKESEQFDLVGGTISLKAFPAIKLGRLAVVQSLHGQGVGSVIMKLIIGEILDTMTLSAGRLLVVDADNEESVVAFYSKQGFVESLWAEESAKNIPRGARQARARTKKMIRDILSTL